uniref:Uncharacterized protein n=1 Tax=Ananas comosus var. bracteatus TaxID=296719 RepID=A0A6V7PAZ0_ANACO|nr:unnamed protein product [Ananas comosus var. bracteatus]
MREVVTGMIPLGRGAALPRRRRHGAAELTERARRRTLSESNNNSTKNIVNLYQPLAVTRQSPAAGSSTFSWSLSIWIGPSSSADRTFIHVQFSPPATDSYVVGVCDPTCRAPHILSNRIKTTSEPTRLAFAGQGRSSTAGDSQRISAVNHALALRSCFIHQTLLPVSFTLKDTVVQPIDQILFK